MGAAPNQSHASLVTSVLRETGFCARRSDPRLYTLQWETAPLRSRYRSNLRGSSSPQRRRLPFTLAEVEGARFRLSILTGAIPDGLVVLLELLRLCGGHWNTDDDCGSRSAPNVTPRSFRRVVGSVQLGPPEASTFPRTPDVIDSRIFCALLATHAGELSYSLPSPAVGAWSAASLFHAWPLWSIAFPLSRSLLSYRLGVAHAFGVSS